MTSDQTPSGGSDQPDQSAPSTPPAAPSAQAGGVDYGSPGGLVAIGGVIVLVGWLITLLANTFYGFNVIHVVLAVAAVAMFFGKSDIWEKIAPAGVVTKVLGYSLALISAVHLIGDVVGGFGFRSGATWFAAIVAYASGVVAFMGARASET